MSLRPPRYVIAFPNERSARSFQFAVDAAIGLPSAGTRIGRGHQGARRNAGTVTHASIHRHASGRWLADVYRGNDGLAWTQTVAIVEEATSGGAEATLSNLANRERPINTLQPNAAGVNWSCITGFFREYLADFLPSLSFDVVEVHAEAQGNGQWKCVVHYLAGDENYVLESHELFDLLRGVELESSFVTWPTAIEEFSATRIHGYYLRVPRDEWATIPKVQSREDLAGIFDSLAGAFVFTLLAYLSIDASRKGSWPLDYDEFNSHRFRTNAARAFLSTVLSGFCAEPRSFHVLDEIRLLATQRYERRAATGGIMFCDPKQEAWIDWSAKLDRPILLTETRRVRKLLEASGDGAYLVSDSVQIFGVGRPSGNEILRYFVVFQDSDTWTFSDSAKSILLESKQGRIQVPAERFDYSRFRRHVEQFIPQMDESAKQALLAVVMGAVAQGHGTTVVITSDGSEVQRLGAGAFQIGPRRLSLEDTQRLTSMDGALLLDMNAACHAFGVILDGQADQVPSEPGRGARYNSAVRYVASQQRRAKACVAIVISEDGGTDLLPNA